MKQSLYFKICVLVFISLCAKSYSQLIDLNEENKKENEKKTFFSLGFGSGYISPEDINRYIYDYYVNEGFSEDNSKADIHLFINMDARFSYFITKSFESYIAYSASVGYSTVQDVDMIGMDNDRLNILLNLSPLLGVNYYLINNNNGSVFLGGAVTWNKLILNVNTDDNTFTGSAPGLKLNFGYSPNLSHLQYEIQFNLAKTKAKQKNSSDWSSVDYPDNLSFSGLSLHFRYAF